jgi:DNA-nicking Smr family endonuclease
MARKIAKNAKSKIAKETPNQDAALWDQIKGSVKPLKNPQNRAKQHPDAPIIVEKAIKRLKKPANRPKMLVQPPAQVPKASELNPGETQGMDKRSGDRLRRGKMKIDRRLDLHGMSRIEAHHALGQCISDSAQAGKRCVLVITGKGSGILRTGVACWLNEASLRPHILAFSEAQPKDGGSGAFYVYLKKRRGP